MSNRIYFGDNLPILQSMPSESIDLIYIDPPFNTKKTQKRTTIKTIRDTNGDRKGFNGNTYRTIELATKAYQDSFEFIEKDSVHPEIEEAYKIIAPNASINYIEVFLRPRLNEARRILKPHGSLYFHIDYREVHYCKLLLDSIFGRESFMNEIIWAYDFGGRARSRWPAKHDNILFYVKDPKSYIFNTSEIDREKYMAPGLVGEEKAARGKLPTDTWWYPYVGPKDNGKSETWPYAYARKRPSDAWWQTIVGTNSKERKGYPTQKPRKLIDRLIKASSHPGNVVLDFFAGSGTVGESCLELHRNFILIDNNPSALEVLAQRFSGIEDIEWINFDPKPFQVKKRLQKKEIQKVGTMNFGEDFQVLVASASYLQRDLEEQNDYWKDSPFEWVLQLSAAKKGKLARQLVTSWCTSKGFIVDRVKSSGIYLTINGFRFAVKMSTRWADGKYKFQQIRDEDYDYVICLGISPLEAHCWVFKKRYAIQNGTPQHKGAKGAEYWIAIDPRQPPEWANAYGGTMERVNQILKGLGKK